MVLQTVGALAVTVITAFLLGMNVWVTGWVCRQPDDPVVKRRLQAERSHIADAFTVIAAMVWLAGVVRAASGFTYGISLLLVVVLVVTVLLRTRVWLRLLVLAAVLGVGVVGSYNGGVFGGQLLVVAVQIALVGVAASWPYWLGNRHTGVAGYYLFAVPRVLIVLMSAAAADVVYGWDDVAILRLAHGAGLFQNVTYPSDAGDGLWASLLYADQHVSLGLFTPVAVAFVISTMTMWARYMNDAYKLVVWPVIGWVAGIVAAFVVAFAHGPLLAAPFIAVGVVVAAILAVWRTRTYKLVGWAQGWHADQSHRSFSGDDAVDFGPHR